MYSPTWAAEIFSLLFSEEDIGYTLNYNSNAVDLVTGDFNGDGKPDLAFTGDVQDSHFNFLKPNIQVLNGNGDGTFTEGTPYTLDSKGWGLAAADLTGDNRTDMVAILDAKNAPGAMPRVATPLHKVGECFYWSSAISASKRPDSLANGVSPLIDFNGDGKLDLLLPHYYQSNGTASITVAQGEGGGKFSAPQAFPAYPNVAFVTANAAPQGRSAKYPHSIPGSYESTGVDAQRKQMSALRE